MDRRTDRRTDAKDGNDDVDDNSDHSEGKRPDIEVISRVHLQTRPPTFSSQDSSGNSGPEETTASVEIHAQSIFN